MRLALHWQILIAIVLAVLAGLWSGTESALFGIRWYEVYTFVGTLFMNALKMIIVPLIVASMISGVASLGSREGFGRLGGKTILYYMSTSLLAIMIGLVMVNVIAPGIVEGKPAGSMLNLGADTQDVLAKVEGRGAGDVVGIFLRMVPTNIVDAAASGQMLGLIFFSLLFGFFMTRIEGPPRETMTLFWEGVLQTMMQITMWVMKFAPIGVFGLVAKTVAATGFSAFQPLAAFFFTVLVALLIHTFIALPLLLRFIGGIKPQRHFRAMAPAMLTAFSTASSSATLPVTLRCVEENAGVSNRTSSFVLPLGATINMDGTALYECVAALFIAQAYGLEITLMTQFTVVFIALITSVGVAGIPAASLVAITIILGNIGLPLEAVGVILVTDRNLDMCRTAVNVFSDSCGAVILARTEGETNVLSDETPDNRILEKQA